MRFDSPGQLDAHPVPPVREATSADYEAIDDLLYALYDDVARVGSVQAPLKVQRERLRIVMAAHAERTQPVVALVAGSPARAMSIWAVTDTDHPTMGVVAEGIAVYVAPELRGQGLAGRLYRTAHGLLALHGVDTLVTITESENNAGRALMDSQGFTVRQLIYTRPLRG